MARSLQMAVEEVRKMTAELGRTAEAARTLGDAFRDALTKAIEKLSMGGPQGSAPSSSVVPAAVAASVVTAAVASSMQRQAAVQAARTAEARQAVAASTATTAGGRDVATATAALPEVDLRAGDSGPLRFSKRRRIVTAMRASLPDITKKVEEENAELEARADLLTGDLRGNQKTNKARGGDPIDPSGPGELAKLGRARAERAERQRLLDEQHGRYFARYEDYSLSTEEGARRYTVGSIHGMRRQMHEADRDMRRATLDERLIGSDVHKDLLASRTEKVSQETVNAVRNEIEALKERDRWASSPAGVQALERELQLRRELQTLESRTARDDSMREARSLTTPEGASQHAEASIAAMQKREADARREIAKASIEGSLIGGEQHRATLSAQSSNEAMQRINAVRTEIEALKERERFASSPAGARMLERERTLRRELERLSGSKRTPEERAQGDRAFDSYIQRTAERTTAVGVGAASSMAPIAVPVEWQTFRRSLEGISASMGTVFGPALNEASSSLQAIADKFDALDSSTKSWIGTLTVGTVGTAALIAVLGRLGLTATVARTAVVRLGQAMTLGMVASPITAGILGVTAVVTGLAAAWTLVAGNARQANDAQREAGGAGPGRNRLNDRITRDRVRQIGESDPQARQEIQRAGEDRAQTMAALQRAQQRADENVIQAQGRVAREQAGNLAEQQVERLMQESAGPYLRRRQQQVREAEPRAAARAAQEMQLPSEAVSVAWAQQQRRIQELLGGRATEDQQRRIMMNVMDVIAPQRDRDGNIVPRRRPGNIQGGDRALQEALAQQELIRETVRSLGGNDLRQSLKGLLPAPQMFQDVAAAGEQMALRTLERQGEQDVLLELKRLTSIASAVGVSLESINTAIDYSNLFRALTPNRR